MLTAIAAAIAATGVATNIGFMLYSPECTFEQSEAVAASSRWQHGIQTPCHPRAKTPAAVASNPADEPETDRTRINIQRVNRTGNMGYLYQLAARSGQKARIGAICAYAVAVPGGPAVPIGVRDPRLGSI
jgi:hypothetical protein